MHRGSWTRRVLLAVLSALLVVATFQLTAPTASADTVPPVANDPANPETVSAKPLPTVQIGDGVVWSQVVVGNTVYVAGNFTTARPAGAAPGANTVTRSNLLAYDIRTGTLIDSWAPSANAEVLAIAASPDGSRIYVGGSFTTINGVTQRRIAALNPTTGALVSGFAPNPDAKVKSLAVTAGTVYYGGSFASVGGATRYRVAASTTAGALLPWAPNADGGQVSAITLTPDQSKVIIGGQFTTVNGSSNPGYGMAALDPTSGALVPWAANASIRNGGANAGITSLTTDADSVYATGFTYGTGGNFEGSSRINTDGTINWVEDCHGDTYSLYPRAGAVYKVGHAHYCGNVPGGFGQPAMPWKFYRGMAFSKVATGVARTEYFGYANWAGTKDPSILQWFPQIDSGTFTGQTQAAWSITGNSDYVVAGGEFPATNGMAQQGLVRYAANNVTPSTQAPDLSGSKFLPTVTSNASGEALVSWQSNYDRDNKNLTYKVIRNGDTANPVYTTTRPSTIWDRPYLSFLDTGLTPGASVSYRISAIDPQGNESRSNTVSVTVSGAAGATDAYSKAVLKDGPRDYWRLNDPAGSTLSDYTGLDPLTATSTVGRTSPGAISGRGAATLSGATGSTASTSTLLEGAYWYSVEAWFQTNSTKGGRIVGFSGAKTGSSAANQDDRQIYMSSGGQLTLGVRQGGSNRTITSSSAYNDNKWHHVVGSVGDNGATLYVDGTPVGNTSDTRTGGSYSGYWRIGGDSLSGWANRPTSDYFAGNVSDVAVYQNALSANQVRSHFEAAGRVTTGPAKPTDAYGAAVYNDGPDQYWRFGETTGTTAADSSQNSRTGTYVNGAILGGASATGLGSDKSVTTDGTNDNIAGNTALTSPSVYSEELWFKTATTRGGQLMGFGSSKTGTSTTNDRYVFMTNAGKLRFGVSPGSESAIESPGAYNNNAWHHLVVTQGTAGMKMYVDGALVVSGPTVNASTFTGYWRVGGDNLAGRASRPTSDYFAGSLDEVAVYPRVLSASEVSSHFSQAGGVANAKPTAAFTSTATDLAVAFNGSTSTDDGTIASYAWDFGDTTSGTGVSPSHSYTAAGTYTVKLTVTDDQGLTDTVSKSVTVTAANVKPTAAFTSSATNLVASFNGSTSTDDGTIASYAWDFGDTTSGTGVSPSHTYTTAGTYTVKLTVTDDKGLTDTVSHDVVVSAAPNAKPTAAFTSTTSGLTASFDGSGSTDDGTIASYAWDFGDTTSGNGLAPSHAYTAAGTYTVKLTVTDDQGLTDTVSHDVVVSAGPANAKPAAAFTSSVTNLAASFDGSGSTDDGTIASYAWDFGDTTSGTGVSPTHSYTTAGTYTVKLTVTDDQGLTDAVSHDVTVTAPGQAAIASDDFGRTTTSGWGSAVAGGAWTNTGTLSNFAVNNGTGAMTMPTAGSTRTMSLNSASGLDSDLTVKFSLDKVPDGSGVTLWMGSRWVGTSGYRVKLKSAADGTITMYLVSTVNNADTVLKTVTLPATTKITAGGQLQVRLQTQGTNATTLRSRVWPVGSTEPTTWQATASDSTASLQSAGGFTITSYLSGSATNSPVVARFDDLLASTL